MCIVFSIVSCYCCDFTFALQGRVMSHLMLLRSRFGSSVPYQTTAYFSFLCSAAPPWRQCYSQGRANRCSTAQKRRWALNATASTRRRRHITPNSHPRIVSLVRFATKPLRCFDSSKSRRRWSGTSRNTVVRRLRVVRLTPDGSATCGHALFSGM